MEITTLPLTDDETETDLDAALATLEEVGIGFTVACSGPEPTCPEWQMPLAA